MGLENIVVVEQYTYQVAVDREHEAFYNHVGVGVQHEAFHNEVAVDVQLEALCSHIAAWLAPHDRFHSTVVATIDSLFA